MKRLALGLAAGVCAAVLGTAAPALGDPGNTATDSTGTVQVGGGNESAGSTGTVQTGSATPDDTRSLAASSGATASTAGAQSPAATPTTGGAAPATGAGAAAGTNGLRTPPAESTPAATAADLASLPFTGAAFGRWLVVGLTLLLTGASLRRRSAS